MRPCTSSLRPHTLVAEGLIRYYRKAAGEGCKGEPASCAKNTGAAEAVYEALSY
jgi:hypothetical protein